MDKDIYTKNLRSYVETEQQLQSLLEKKRSLKQALIVLVLKDGLYECIDLNIIKLKRIVRSI